MGPKSFKRFTIKAKQSFSGLKPPCEGYDAPNHLSKASHIDNKENQTPDLEDFGSFRTDSNSVVSDINCSPLAKDSPSRRKWLMGSLRSMSSMRNFGSPTSKEKSKDDVGYAAEPDRSRTTLSLLQIRPSLALNFEESPPDQPMFDLPQHRCFVRSSMVPHPSSPVPIPIPTKQDDQSYPVLAHPGGILTRTSPASTNPLQMILDTDSSQTPGSSLVRPQTEVVTHPLPTPMPGTNMGFSEDDINGDLPLPHVKVPSLREPPSYLCIPATYSSDNMDLSNIIDEALQLADMAASPNSFISPKVARGSITMAALDEVEKARRLKSRTYKRDSPTEIDDNSVVKHDFEAPIAIADESPHDMPNHTEIDPPNQCSSPINIEHIVFEDYPEVHTLNQQTTHKAYVGALTQAQTQICIQKEAQLWLASKSQPHTVDNSNPQPVNNAWGTHGSLYDGTGYGNESNSTLPRASTSSVVVKVDDNNLYTPALLVEDSAAMAHDHETLEEVIRAYAIFEEKGTCEIGEESMEEFVADVEMAKKMADYSLGA